MWTSLVLFLRLFSRVIDLMNGAASRRSSQSKAKIQNKANAYEKLSKAVRERDAVRGRIKRSGVYEDGFKREK